jgi:hypothetical protein
MAETNWFKELQKINQTDTLVGFAFGDKLYSSPEEIRSDIDYNFDNGYGTEEGFAFTAWSQSRVYFPVKYDGSEWITSVPRNPSNEATSHIGRRDGT